MRDGTRWWRDLAGEVSTGSTADREHPATGRYEMCVYPESLPDRLDFEGVGAGERVGREVIRTNAHPLPPRPLVSGTTRIVPINLSSWFPLPVFSNGEDDYTVEIDAATGVILRIASVFENQDWMVIEAVSAVVRQAIAREHIHDPGGSSSQRKKSRSGADGFATGSSAFRDSTSGSTPSRG